jgi:dsDNA-specific endonuclease/ATPase MutS2
MYFLTLEIVENSNTILPEELQSLFNDFLEVENENNTEEAREKLRLSARKQAKKLFIKIKNLGYYVK